LGTDKAIPTSIVDYHAPHCTTIGGKMRAVRLAIFGIVGLGIVLFGLALAIGWRPLSSAPVTVAPPAPAAETVSTAPAEPTLTSEERAIAESMSARAESMVKAVHDLQALGQEIRATALWKGKVQAAALIITGGQMVIQQAALPARYGPLKATAKTTTDACAAAVRSLPSADTLTIAALTAIDPQLVTCERDLKRLQLSISGL
jgi:hypothetical protein